MVPRSLRIGWGALVILPRTSQRAPLSARSAAIKRSVTGVGLRRRVWESRVLDSKGVLPFRS